MGAPLPPRTRRTCDGRFRKGVLAPLWVMQLLVMFAVVGVEVYTGLQELSEGKGSSRCVYPFPRINCEVVPT